MKNLSLILNAILILAVGFLYYKDFACKKNCEKKTYSATCTKKVPEGKSACFAYVELDSLNEKISFIKNNRKSLEAEQEAIESEWQSGYQRLENKKNEFLKKGKSITQAEAEDFQASLYSEQQAIDNKKQSLTQKLNEKSYKLMDGIQQKLKSFLEDYNKDKKFTYIFSTGNGLDYIAYKDSSYNITDDVVTGMNEMIESEKQ